MLDVNLLRTNSEELKKKLATKNVDPKMVDDFLGLDTKWREAVKATEALRAQLNKLSKERKIDEAKVVKEKLKASEQSYPELEKQRLAALKALPNPPLPDVPVGDESKSVVLREVGDKPKFDFPVKNYIEIGQSLDIIDTERAGKVSGSRFGYLKGAGALLEFGLIQLVVDFVTNEKNIAKIIKEQKLSIKPSAFVPVIPPVLIKPESMQAMGYVERGGDEIYFLEKDQLYLVGTSEQSIGPMHMNETLDKEALPVRYLGFSTCFRREAGSYGKDTKGILRVHQFDKLEMFTICLPENSGEEHKLLLAIEEKLMQMLELPYHVLHIATGDLGDPAAAKYDIEAWLPGQREGAGEYRETHSTSNTTDYQARRLNIRIKNQESGIKNEYAHMLNGTAFAIGRIIIAILENYQTKTGSVKVPKALRDYLHLKEIGVK
ncbi:MAG: seryl-tRNA synthetase [Parcubacteria group bacterium Gr01-1014_3]|nr:MAG: seryl-tRNA synthetase [Parcubacteria group bacterium Gr01-1014_3]